MVFLETHAALVTSDVPILPFVVSNIPYLGSEVTLALALGPGMVQASKAETREFHTVCPLFALAPEPRRAPWKLKFSDRRAALIINIVAEQT